MDHEVWSRSMFGNVARRPAIRAWLNWGTKEPERFQKMMR